MGPCLTKASTSTPLGVGGGRCTPLPLPWDPPPPSPPAAPLRPAHLAFIRDPALLKALEHGIGFYHEGLPRPRPLHPPSPPPP